MLAVGRLAGVAGRGDHDDAERGRFRDFFTQGVGRGRLGHRMAEREIDHADVVTRAIVDGPFHPGDHVARESRAVGTEHAHVDDLSARGDAACVQARVLRVRAADDSGDVGAVAEDVDRLARAGHEVHVRDDVPERRVRRDARVEHGDADALTVHCRIRAHESQQAPRAVANLRRASRDGRDRHQEAHPRIGRHVIDRSVRGELAELSTVDSEHGRLVELTNDGQVMPCRQRLYFGAASVHDDAHALRRMPRFVGEKIRGQAGAMAAAPSLNTQSTADKERRKQRQADAVSHSHERTPTDTKRHEGQPNSNCVASDQRRGARWLTVFAGMSYRVP